MRLIRIHRKNDFHDAQMTRHPLNTHESTDCMTMLAQHGGNVTCCDVYDRYTITRVYNTTCTMTMAMMSASKNDSTDNYVQSMTPSHNHENKNSFL